MVYMFHEYDLYIKYIDLTKLGYKIENVSIKKGKSQIVMSSFFVC